jgi:hypothetical protein
MSSIILIEGVPYVEQYWLDVVTIVVSSQWVIIMMLLIALNWRNSND